jgi:hypothetical protein
MRKESSNEGEGEGEEGKGEGESGEEARDAEDEENDRGKEYGVKQGEAVVVVGVGGVGGLVV